MDKKYYGFGIVGAGVISHFHAQAIAEIERAKLVGIYSINKVKSEPFAEKHQCQVFDTLKEMLAHPDIDIICICTPSGIHLEPALASIRAGKHCLVEKPLEVTLSRCDQIIQEASQAGVKVGVIFPSRFYEDSQRLKRAADANRFGTLVFGDAYVKWERTPEYYKSGKWRGTWDLDGGGALMNQGIHSIDLLQWIMGEIEYVQAVTANRRHQNIQVEDTVVATVKFRSGALGAIQASTAVYPGMLKRLEIMGTDGTAILEDNDLIKWTFRDHLPDDEASNVSGTVDGSTGGASDPASIHITGHKNQIEDMILSIETGKEPLITAQEGRKSVEIVMAIYQSAERGERVSLPLTT